MDATNHAVLEPLLKDDTEEFVDSLRSCPARRPRRGLQIRFDFASATILAFLLGLVFVPAVSKLFEHLGLLRHVPDQDRSSQLSMTGDASNLYDHVQLCESADVLPVKAPRKNVWQNIDISTATAIREWLYQPARGLNLTRASEAKDNDNSIFLVEAYLPSKSAALAYLDDEGGQVAAPDKYVHAVINKGVSEEIIDYLIGPLPLSDHTTIRPLREIYHRPEIPYHARGFGYNSSDLGLLMARTFGPLAELTNELFGGICRGLANDTLIGAASAPLSYDGSWRRMWMQMKLNVPGHYLFPVNLYTYFDLSGTDPTHWHVLSIMYNNQTFSGPDELKAAWESGKLVKSKKPLGPSDDTPAWATRTRTGKGKKRDLDERAGPRSVSFDGLRFRVDQEEQYITWMGWTFYLGFQRDMGLNLWDIRFRGERIIYEISPQEAMAQYSGTDPRQGSTVYLDRAFGMGAAVKELMVGYDCPGDAVYLPATVHQEAGSSTRLNAICIFEKDSAKPLSRHTGWLKDEMGAVKGYELTVRSVSTVGNYDYIFDYTFQLDGTIELRVSASGYLQGGYWDQSQFPYGHAIRETTMGSLHDHVINYKIDFDIAGTQNSLTAAMLEVEEIAQPWLDQDWGETMTQQRIIRKKIVSEDDSRLDYPHNMEGMYIISNEEEVNAWGNPRGYAIHPGPSAVHLTNLNCRRTKDNVNWAKHSLSVTQRHDNEPYSSSLWNIHLPGAPTVDFYQFFNGESLDQEDLVVWLNLGTHHMPRAEDSPHTLTNAASSAVMLIPFNFNDFDVSMEAMNSVILNAGPPGQAWSIDENNVKPSFCLPPRPSDFSYTGLLSFEENGSPAVSGTLQAQREIAESWHGLHAQI